MAELRLTGVQNRILKPIDLRVADGALFAVVGPSGAGKTTLLRVIAGLAGHQGQVWLDKKQIQLLPPHKRAMGYVSQDVHLFPHQTLEGNLRIAMTRLHWNRIRQRRRRSELLTLLRITHLAGRKPETFSGGEKQRAALARVLASAPRLLLLDEPFSQLDFRTARYLRTEFKGLQKKLGLTTIVVTHNLEEARYLADDLAVMQAGQLSRPGKAGEREAWGEENTDAFLETPNCLTCRIVGQPCPGLVEVLWGEVRLLAPDIGRPFDRVSIRRWDIELGAEPPQGPPINRFTGRVSAIELNDDSAKIVCQVNGGSLYVETTHEKWQQSALSVGCTAHGLMRLQALEPV